MPNPTSLAPRGASGIPARDHEKPPPPPGGEKNSDVEPKCRACLGATFCRWHQSLAVDKVTIEKPPGAGDWASTMLLRRVLEVLIKRTNVGEQHNGEGWPSLSTLANDVGCSRRQIITALQILRWAGKLRQKLPGYKKRVSTTYFVDLLSRRKAALRDVNDKSSAPKGPAKRAEDFAVNWSVLQRCYTAARLERWDTSAPSRLEDGHLKPKAAHQAAEDILSTMQNTARALECSFERVCTVAMRTFVKLDGFESNGHNVLVQQRHPLYFLPTHLAEVERRTRGIIRAVSARTSAEAARPTQSRPPRSLHDDLRKVEANNPALAKILRKNIPLDYLVSEEEVLR